MGAEFHLKQNLEPGEYLVSVKKVDNAGCMVMIFAVGIAVLLASSAFALT